MRRYFITLILLVLGTLMGQAQYSVLNGDLDHDGRITQKDVEAMADIILEKDPVETIKSTSVLSYHLMDSSAELLAPEKFKAAIAKLVEDDDVRFIEKITFRKGHTTDGIVVSSAGSQREIRAVWVDEDVVIDIYVDADRLIFPKSCHNMFSFYENLTEIDWSAFGTYIDTDNVMDMSGMFSGCKYLTAVDVSNFDTSNVMDMSGMFSGCNALTTLDVSNFNTSNVMDMSEMFAGCWVLTTLDVSHFDTHNVTDMHWMFNSCQALTTLDVSHFDTSKVTLMQAMFAYCDGLTTLDLSNFNTSKVTDMHLMFLSSHYLTTLDLSNFDTRNVTDMSLMFLGCYRLSSLKLGSSFTISDSCDIEEMLCGAPWNEYVPSCTITCTAATKAKLCDPKTKIDESMINWNLLDSEEPEEPEQSEPELVGSSAELLDPEKFKAAIAKLVEDDDVRFIEKITFRKGHTTDGIVVSSTRSQREIRAVWVDEDVVIDIYVDADRLIFPKSCHNMFSFYENLTEIDWSAFGTYIDTHNVMDMSGMFSGCKYLTAVDVSNFDTSIVLDMSGMFSGCNALTTLDVSNFNTSNVMDMSEMFAGCWVLTTLDVSHFDTHNVTDMHWMFNSCQALTTLDVSHFDTSKVTLMQAMFADCDGLTTLDLSHFNTSKVTDMHLMFLSSHYLTTLDLSNFDTRNVTDMSLMFLGCYRLSSLKLGCSFTISDSCDIEEMLCGAPWNEYVPSCTITCTAATKAKLCDPKTKIDESMIKWIEL